MSQRSDDDYKKRQLEFYESNADGWDAWANAVAEQAEAFNAPLIEAAHLTEGKSVLDLASGAGEPALTAAKSVGERGHVSATDLSQSMLDIAERRANELGLDNMSFGVSDMETLPFDDADFDAVICRFGIMYSPDPERTLAESRRVIRPGGRAAFMVWGPKGNNSLLWTVIETGNRETGHFEDDELDHPFCYAEPQILAPLLQAAGFVDVQESDLRFNPRIPKSVPFWKPLVGMNFGGALAGMSDDDQADLDRKVEAAFAPYLEDDKYHLSAHVRIVSGLCP